uniref:Alpha-mannosidase n=1 Tax=Phallusia mammillata TaxID=59560 RepID=A0A6F9DKU6_9ASCI|nr:lysosomal alpha-mannosidase-like [Phallusia mammillata]
MNQRLFFGCILFLPSVCWATSCGYSSCNMGNKDHLNVHLVPHTHDDVGWLKTVDQYYYGANNSIAIAGVQYILDTVVPHLMADSTKRFIYVEMAFFYRWWNQQSEQMKSDVKMLVEEGRLEFILGGWCMNDEASTHYNAIIDQMSLGMTFLNETFGSCGRPRVAWQIDPFGHSREQASLFAQMGFDGLFFGRLDYQDKALREKEVRMEEIWRGSETLTSPQADLFTGINENGYGPPKGFCFDELCGDSPIMDDPNLEEYNVDDKVNFFADAARHQAKHFKTNHIMMTMGSDFQYSNAHTWYKNLDKLIKYVNAANKNITVFYSTPSCYLYALNEVNEDWTIKTDDFFPYADIPHGFWTGYFTSRPALKGYVRESNNLLQVCKQLEVLAGPNKIKSSSATLREAMGVTQHHDAVSGTSKQHVANDYAKRLYKGRSACHQVVSEVITGESNNLHVCDYLNITFCNYTQQMNEFVVIAYNPLARSVEKYLRIPVDSVMKNSMFDVTEVDSGKSVTNQLVPVSDATKSVRRTRGNADSELVFLADLPPFGYKEYKVSKQPVLKKFSKQSSVSKTGKDDITIANAYYKVQFDGSTGLMKTIVNTANSIEMNVSQNLYWYNASTGNNASNQPSGAYVFRPNSSHTFPCADGIVETHVLQGNNPLVQEVYQKFSDWAWQVVRLYNNKKYIEVEWTIGPIPIKDGLGKEVISRFETPLATAGYFYTDANGREVLERKRDYRPTWTLNQTEPVAGNYYPVNSRIYIKDSKFQLTVLNDRSQGGASLSDGSLELMLHRRLLVDDKRGVGEPLNETGQFGDGLIVRGKQLILLDTIQASGAQQRLLAEEMYMDTFVAFRNVSTASNGLPPGSALSAPLPENVHLLTLETTSSGQILIRLEHQFALNDDAQLSKPVTVSLKGLIKGFEPVSVEELVLSGNALKSQVTRLQWKSKTRPKRDAERQMHFEKHYDATNGFGDVLYDQFDVTLQPMQIRTFLMR